MRPAWSVILFTTLAGLAQGLVVALAVMLLKDVPLLPGYARLCLTSAIVLLLAALVASFTHLGRPERAWRAVLRWRTSWLSREVIVLPLFIALLVLWWLALPDAGAEGAAAPVQTAVMFWPVAAIALAALLWLCTAMIYACLKFVREWAHPHTLINFTLIGLASGTVLAAALAARYGDAALAARIARIALVATGAAGLARLASLKRNATLRSVSTLQSATGIQSQQLVQTSMGMSGGAFNTREFFHGASATQLLLMRAALVWLGFAIPAALLAAATMGWTDACLWAVPLQWAGLLAERWTFFAEARHPQNLYYQRVS